MDEISCPECGFSQTYSEWSEDMDPLSEVDCPQCDHEFFLSDHW